MSNSRNQRGALWFVTIMLIEYEQRPNLAAGYLVPSRSSRYSREIHLPQLIRVRIEIGQQSGVVNQVVMPLVPKSKGEHAAELFYARGTVLFKGMKDGFRIAVSAVAVARGLQQRPQRRMIKDLAVVDDPQRLVFIGHGLAAQRKIDDA